jgi:hypothetical protein
MLNPCYSQYVKGVRALVSYSIGATSGRLAEFKQMSTPKMLAKMGCRNLPSQELHLPVVWALLWEKQLVLMIKLLKN